MCVVGDIGVVGRFIDRCRRVEREKERPRPFIYGPCVLMRATRARTYYIERRERERDIYTRKRKPIEDL